MLKAHVVHAGGERVDCATFDPFDPHVGEKVVLPYFFYVIEHPRGVVLFDTGAPRAFIEDPARLGAAAEFWHIEMSEGDDVLSKLHELGIEPDSVRHVVHSHLHYDHCGGAGLFNNAAYYIQRRELGFAYHPPPYQADIYVPWAFEQVREWVPLDGALDLFGDGTITIFPTPGHTPGHQSMLVQLRSQPLILCADATYDLTKMRERALPAVHWSAEHMLQSWELLEMLERQHGAELVITHERDFADKLRLAPEAWYE